MLRVKWGEKLLKQWGWPAQNLPLGGASVPCVVDLNMADSKYVGWTVNKLKTELASRGASLTGRKEALVERLEAYDRNSNFRGDVIVLPDQTIPNWPASGFKQLVRDHKVLLPKITRGQIDGYFKYRVAVDKNITGDLKALEKGQMLLESQRISACSVHITTVDVHFTGIVAAAMKKKVSYTYKIRANSQNGEILNSDCECPAGKGPHSTCKHVAAVLLMVAEFISSGQILIKKSCTDSLQNFHAPKRCHGGSPVKAEDLPSNKRPCLEDPRLPAFRNLAGYNDRVRNLVINYCSSSKKTLTMLYLYPKADVQTASVDHHYLRKPFTQYWIEKMFQLTTSEAVDLEKKTRDQSASAAWHEAREWRITASRFGDITKMTYRRNTDKLCESIRDPPNLTSPAVVHGLKFEPIAKSKFEKMSGLKVHKCGLFVDPEYPWLGASPDGVIDEQQIVEIKCPYTGRQQDIKPSKEFPFLKYVDNHLALKRDHKYYDQIQGQLYISKREICHFIVYTEKDMFTEKIHIDRIYCMHSLIPKLEVFYSKYFVPHLARNL